MILKILTDVHISPLTVTELQRSRYQVNRATDYLPPNATDYEIIDLALKDDAVILAQDLDFSALVVQSGLNKASIISLRIGNVKPRRVTSILKTVLPLIEKELLAGAIVSVEETQFRVCKLPIQ